MEFVNFSEIQEEQIKEVLDNYQNFFNSIELDPSLNKKDTKFKIFGSYLPSKKVLKLNPKVFVSKGFEDNGKKMSMLEYVLFHEIAHTKWKNLPEDKKQEWYNISGWQLNPTIKENLTNLAIPQEGNKKLISNWYYSNVAEGSFCRWYSRRNPKDDFSDTWVFVKKGLIGRLEGSIGKQKVGFIKKYG